MKCKGKVNNQRIHTIQKKVDHLLPHSYISLMKKCDGGTPLKCDFEYYDTVFQERSWSGIGCLLTLSDSQYSDYLKFFNDPPEFFPEGLIAFAETGGGDYICFDFKNKLIDEPKIVLWRHSADLDKDVSFVANNFKEFLNILKEPQDE